MFTKEIQFRQVPTSKSFILEKSLSLWIYKRSLTGKERSFFGHYSIVILTQGLSNFYLT